MAPGPPPESTAEQRRRVYELADAGRSERAIAEEVFGSARLRGRVTRLLARRRRASPIGAVDVEAVTLEDLGEAHQAAMRVLHDKFGVSEAAAEALIPAESPC